MLRNLQLGLSPIHHIHCWKKTTHQYHHHFLPPLNWKTLPFGVNLAQPYSSQLSSRPTLQMSSKTQDSEGSSSSRTISPPKATHHQRIKFCQSCGGPTNYVVPDGEEKLRAVCSVCDKVYYENPKMVVGCLVEHNNKVLLCKRKIEPSYGLWTLPAGYMEIGESAAEGAARETLEEACAEVEVLSPFAQLDIPLIGQSYIIFHSKLKRPHFSPGPESLECAFFALEDIPYDSLAFSSVHVTLKMFTEDVKEGKVRFHYCTIIKRPGGGPSDTQGFTVGHHLCI